LAHTCWKMMRKHPQHRANLISHPVCEGDRQDIKNYCILAGRGCKTGSSLK
jgi:hypothetical protein